MSLGGRGCCARGLPNGEDEEHGRFFQDRYKSVRLIDEASLPVCAAYVDLNPVRAAMAQTIEQSDHTSVQRRIKGMREETQAEQRPKVGPTEPRSDAFLSPLTIDEVSDSLGPCGNTTGDRCSDKGSLTLSESDYVQLADWTAQQEVAGKQGVTPQEITPVIKRLSLAPTAWTELVNEFGRLFSHVAGHPRQMDDLRSHQTHRRFRVRARVRELMPATD